MMSRVKRVLRHAVTGYIPQGTGNSAPLPLLDQIKTESKPEVTELLKQEKPQELSKMPDEEQPACYEDPVCPGSVEVSREIRCGSENPLAFRVFRRAERTGLRLTGCSHHDSAYGVAQIHDICLSRVPDAPMTFSSWLATE